MILVKRLLRLASCSTRVGRSGEEPGISSSLAEQKVSHCETARTLRSAAAPKGQITEEITILLTGAIYGKVAALQSP